MRLYQVITILLVVCSACAVPCAFERFADLYKDIFMQCSCLAKDTPEKYSECGQKRYEIRRKHEEEQYAIAVGNLHDAETECNHHTDVQDFAECVHDYYDDLDSGKRQPAGSDVGQSRELESKSVDSSKKSAGYLFQRLIQELEKINKEKGQ